MTLDFKNENAIVTKSRHYALLISPSSKILNNVITGTNTNIKLISMSNESKRDTTVKLHRQFFHPPPVKLSKTMEK